MRRGDGVTPESLAGLTRSLFATVDGSKNRTVFLLIMMVILASFLFPPPAFSRLNLPQHQETVSITGQDHEALRDFFGQSRRYGRSRQPNDQVRRILLEALPGVYTRGCAEVVSTWGTQAEGTAAMAIKVLHVEGRRNDKPVSVLIAYGCFSTAKEYVNQFRDERLAALVIDREVSRLFMVPHEKDCHNCPDLTHITLDKVVNLFGKTVVGISFATSSENPCCNGPSAWKEERVNFYVLKDNGVRPAGSALKRRWTKEHDDEAGDEETGYSAAVILKKDMKGNIVGILSPYKLKKNGKLVEKGMVRYNWDNGKEEFVRE